MWTATLQQVIKDGEPQVLVLFTDSIRYKISEYFKLMGQTSDSLRGTIEARRKQLETSFTFIDTLDTSFSLDPLLSKTVLAPLTYDQARFNLLLLKQDLDLGLTDQATYDLAVKNTLALKP